ncbi:MAG: hypothetical protein JXR83_08910 [Deltaproteobacteria bacterium]|nr:hypothetical protein [Deltaproteobacteria bacterium]
MRKKWQLVAMLGAVVGPGVAQAQVTAISQMTDTSFNAGDCDSDTLLSATFTYSGAATYTPQYTLFGLDAVLAAEVTGCANQPPSDEIFVDNEYLPVDGSVVLPDDVEVTVGDLLYTVCGESRISGLRILCMRVTDIGSTIGYGGGIVFNVDTEVPAAPTSYTWQGSDGAIVLSSVTPPADTRSGETLTYVVEIRPCAGAQNPDLDAGVVDAGGADAAIEDAAGHDAAVADAASGDDAAIASTCGASGDFRRAASGVQPPLTVGGLENGRSYEVRLYVQDGAGNVGPTSAVSVLTPHPEYGFWDIYQGQEEGFSCSQPVTSAGGTCAALALLLGGAAWRRRRRRGPARAANTLFALVAWLAVAGSAHAEMFDVAARLSAGPYKPDLDREAGANGVYNCLFDDKTWVLGAFGADLVLFDRLGTLTLGGEVAYFTVGGRERLTAGNGVCGGLASSHNALHLLPLSANLHYRFDWPYALVGFPLAPYARVGVNATPWALTRNGEFKDTGGPTAGVRTGWQWAAGIAFILDVFDETRMRRVRESGAFQHALLFAEWRELHVDSFGQPGFVLGDQTWLLGLELVI